VLPGNTTDNKILRLFLSKIDKIMISMIIAPFGGVARSSLPKTLS
jgi:hypothetical protein